MDYTICPNQIVNDNRIDANAFRIWVYLAQFEDISEEKGVTKKIAKALKLSEKTVLAKIKSLIKNGYLNRTQKTNGEFGFNYSIPEQYKLNIK